MITTPQSQIQDAPQRDRALNPAHSFIVQAPAGSGKTELLTQRFLVLLAHVTQPEEILAITFTKKAAAEMRARIIKTLQTAHNDPEPEAAHAKKTWHLAKRALQQDSILNWNLLANPNRLRIQTIDSFNVSLTKHLPILSQFGAPPEITDDAEFLYRSAIQEFLSHLEENVEWSDAIAKLLAHRDNNLDKVQELLVALLGKRDQWLRHMMVDSTQPDLRAELEMQLANVVTDILTKLHTQFPQHLRAELLELINFAADNLRRSEDTQTKIRDCLDLVEFPGTHLEDLTYWQGIKELLFTQETTWRKAINKNQGFPAADKTHSPVEKHLLKNNKDRILQLIEHLSHDTKLQHAFLELSFAPAYEYQESQWQILHALYETLRIVIAQLTVSFRRHGQIDYIENARAAALALGTDDAPTDLALALDYQIKHILIDEFQDTSNSQYHLIKKLIAGWESNDGRTLFVVGDPMQSIYRFREADVGNFMHARQHGIGNVKLEPLTLAVNFRSTATVVDWVNAKFRHILAPYDDVATGAVAYSESIANTLHSNTPSTVQTHIFNSTHPDAQAQAVVALIQKTQQDNPGGTIAILVRARAHLTSIIQLLKKADINYRAVKIDPLDSRTVIQDLMALTRALLNPADRVAWLAVLRAPWCGLTLDDLLMLAGADGSQPLLEHLKNPLYINQVSADGQTRLSRVLPVLIHQIKQRKRLGLRFWIEGAWLLLGGPACLEQLHDLEDVAAYFDLLENLDSGCDLVNLDTLKDDVSKLFAAPNNQADTPLQIMTIHNAKGLEFDTVILPFLERSQKSDNKPLLNWLEVQRENGPNSLILAPLHATGDKSDAIYHYIKYQVTTKFDHEVGRLLYVAATRAKHNLHLLLSPTLKDTFEETSELAKPKLKSLFEKLRPAITRELAAFKEQENSAPTELNSQPTKPTRLIKRLQSTWQNPIVDARAGLVDKQQSLPALQLTQDYAKYIGTVVHLVLQQISRSGASWWQTSSPEQLDCYLKNHLSQLGVGSAALEPTAATVYQAIENTLHDDRGQWILQKHAEEQTEFALTAVIDSQVEKLVLDKTFVDSQNRRWIVDYKTTQFTGKNLTEFFLQEQQKYAEKMRHYQEALQSLDKRPIHLGLYYPLIPAWHEWIF